MRRPKRKLNSQTSAGSKSKRSVVIIGASGGIGRALLESYRGEPVSIYATANERYDELCQYARKSVAAAEYLSITALRANVARMEDIDRLVETLLDRLSVDQGGGSPRIDELAIAFGIDLMTPKAKALSFDARLGQALRVDLYATAVLARRLGNVMRLEAAEQKRDRAPAIALFSWDGVQTGRGGESSLIYGATKGGVAGFARSLAKELAPWVRVNTVSPGWIATTWGRTAPEEVRERCAKDSLLNRWGEAAEVANVVRFLLSEDASYVNGQEIAVNGGRS